MRGRGSGPPPPPPEKSQNIGFLSNTGPDPLKNQCWALIGTPTKRHLKGVSLACRKWPDYSDIWILGPHRLQKNKTNKTKNDVEVGPSDKTFWIGA